MKFESFVDNVKRTLRNAVGGITGEATPVIAGHLSADRLLSRSLVSPAIDVLENEVEIRIIMDVPGGSPDNTFVHREAKGLLSVYVRSKATSEPPYGFEQDDRPTDWYQTIELPEYGKASESTASVRRGVLTIRIPKRRKPTPVKIPVEVKL